jgi:peptidoglycan-associated lipoprotein
MNARTLGIALSALAILNFTGCASKNSSAAGDAKNGQLSASKGGPGSKDRAGGMREDGTFAPGTPGTGPDGKPLYGVGPDGRPFTGIGPDGKPFTGIGPDGQPLPGFSADGRPLPGFGHDGQPLPGFGQDGQPLTGFTPGSSRESGVGTGPRMLSKADAQALESQEARRLREEGRKSLADIYFAYDRWGLSEEGKKNLSKSAGFLKKNPQAKLIIEGHCDERGSGEYNLALGEKRAKEALQYLSDLGIHNIVAVTSYGKERPSCKEQDEACYSKNRRAHLLVETD